MGFQENLATLPTAESLVRIELTDLEGGAEFIENRPGSQGSLRVYQHLALKYGEINPAAAAEGLALYAEHTEDARVHPGKHPNIDRLLDVQERNLRFAARLIAATP